MRKTAISLIVTGIAFSLVAPGAAQATDTCHLVPCQGKPSTTVSDTIPSDTVPNDTLPDDTVPMDTTPETTTPTTLDIPTTTVAPVQTTVPPAVSVGEPPVPTTVPAVAPAPALPRTGAALTAAVWGSICIVLGAIVLRSARRKRAA